MSRLERWSRRKRGLDAEPTSSAEDEGSGEAPPRRVPAPVDKPIAHDTDAQLDDTLPDPESLPPGSDVSRYLQEGVSQVLRRRALRRLWQAEHYQVRDGLDDYDGDYSQLETMGREVAERLRHWSRRVGDALESEEDDTEHTTVPVDERAASADEANADAPPAEVPVDPDRDTTGRLADDQGGIGNISDNRQD
ncbi:DUF3306 domain-containing protein [Halomonas sp. HK25]|uniref:DUF3306 domain-containing protein n=1 Tax=Halomonas sp. HK25 TaxID=3394321 RepID=UPI0039FCD1A3